MSLRSWRNPQNGRCYQALLGRDLFGDLVLWRGWCGADGRRGGEMAVVLEGEAEGVTLMRRVERRRERRGYVEAGR